MFFLETVAWLTEDEDVLMRDDRTVIPALDSSPRWRWLLVWIVALALGLATLVSTGRAVSERNLREAAGRAAIDYANVIAAAVPNLRTLLERGRPTPLALEQLDRLREVGSVFRFKLFDRDGTLLLVSDQLDEEGFGAGGDHLERRYDTSESSAADAVRTGQPIVELEDGAGRADRPEHYSEAYVPIAIDGDIIGVVEVYVDQTLLARQSRHTFLVTGAVTVVVTLLLALLGILQVGRRMAQARRVEQSMSYLARHDALSGALNRVSFTDLLGGAARRHERDGETFAVICIDLDRFKAINDSLGHAAGDEVIRQTTARLGMLLRHGDHLARLGGDEFVILQSDVLEVDAVRTLAERVVAALSPPYALDGGEVSCGGSVGAAIFGTDATELDELMHKADLALYRAKRAGRSAYRFHDAGAADEEAAVPAAMADGRVRDAGGRGVNAEGSVDDGTLSAAG